MPKGKIKVVKGSQELFQGHLCGHPATEQVQKLFWERLGFWLLLEFSYFPTGRLRFSTAVKNDREGRVETVNL